MFSAVTKKNLNQEIASRITDNILQGKLKPGEKLPPERELSIMMNVNRNTLREALKKLEILGLLTIRQGDGIYIKDYKECGNLELLKIMLNTGGTISPVILKGILQIRRIVIPEMSALAAQNRSINDLEKIKALIDNSSMDISAKDLEIHRIIASAGGNLFYSFLLNFFNDTFIDYSHLYFSLQKNMEKSIRFHKEIYSALKKGDAEKSRKVMLDILIYAERETLINPELNNDKT
jgi:GntR family transcriptional repressor for pyruvate dehydrogenase complex